MDRRSFMWMMGGHGVPVIADYTDELRNDVAMLESL